MLLLGAARLGLVGILQAVALPQWQGRAIAEATVGGWDTSSEVMVKPSGHTYECADVPIVPVAAIGQQQWPQVPLHI